jgi:hypothetical protein
MALVCSSRVARPSTGFEFIDCGTISINYNIRGIASISFTVVSSDGQLSNDYTDLTFGGVNFKGFIRDVNISPIPGTVVSLIRISYEAFGC